MAEKIDFKHATLSGDQTHFIATFLRFEFALKEAGYCQPNGGAAVDWPKVADELGEKFLELLRAENIANTLINHPPKKQVVQNSTLDWKDIEPVQNTQGLLEAVRRTRNNLLHGGKSYEPSSERDRKLIAESQAVIERILLQLDSVRDFFERRY